MKTLILCVLILTSGCSTMGAFSRGFGNGYNTARANQTPFRSYKAPTNQPVMYNRSGNTVYGSDGTMCTKTGETVYCN